MSLCSIKYNKTETTKLNLYLSTFYKDLVESSQYIKKLKIDITDHSKSMDINRSNLSKMSNKYFPTEILKYIIQYRKQKITYSTKINDKNIVLNILNFNMSGYNYHTITNYVDIILIIIHMLSQYSVKKCGKKLIITIFLTPFKRIFPQNKKDIIGPENVNGGFSNIGCLETSSITIYREEEWLKVLIHELFHNLNLDFATMNIDKWVPILLSKFEIKSEYNIYETYCETWARILNVAIKSFFFIPIPRTSYLQKIPTRTAFHSTFHKLMQKERLFSLKQANLILKRFKHPLEYLENSNVFCYYILTASLLNNYLEFFEWCNKNNTNLLKFKTTDKSVKLFIELILTEINSEKFKDNLKCVNAHIKGNEQSLRMTII